MKKYLSWVLLPPSLTSLSITFAFWLSTWQFFVLITISTLAWWICISFLLFLLHDLEKFESKSAFKLIKLGNLVALATFVIAPEIFIITQGFKLDKTSNPIQYAFFTVILFAWMFLCIKLPGSKLYIQKIRQHHNIKVKEDLNEDLDN